MVNQRIKIMYRRIVQKSLNTGICGIGVMVCFALAFSGSCSSEDPEKLSNVNGTWTYTTPNNKVTITFDLKDEDGAVELSNFSFSLDGIVYNSAIAVDGATSTHIEKIRANVNDSKAVYPYYIELEDCSPNAEFTKINVVSGSYSYPRGKINELENVQIIRVE